jgi:predicted ATPase
MTTRKDSGTTTSSTLARQLVGKLRKKREAKMPVGFITHVRFPRFKNLKANASITFKFPVTALVGPNGCGKTTVLHALYGAPRNQSTSDFWFTTHLDPIEEGDGEPNRFIFGHVISTQTEPVETRKARVSAQPGRGRKPGYFEPTKATVGDRMDLSPFRKSDASNPHRSKDRWNPPIRDVLFINFRSELSAFDKALYWGKRKATKSLPTKQHRLQRDARRLAKAISVGGTGHYLRKHQAVSENRDLTEQELSAVNNVLGKTYTDARLVRHSYYGEENGLSVRFATSNLTYSEAFAGSGELAVVSLIVQLLNARTNTLVLLDEPEVSLHPGAQERLAVFLLEQALKNDLQIIFTTHSPALVSNLPEEAVKLFFEDSDGKFSVTDSAHPLAAFNRLGAPVPNRLRIVVEDELARVVVDKALSKLNEDEAKLFSIEVFSGGAQEFFAHRAPGWMLDSGRTFMLLDGDQRPKSGFPHPDTIPKSDNAQLGQLISSLVGCVPHLASDGGNDPDAKDRLYELQRRYLEYLHKFVFFLPLSCPEEIVLRTAGELDQEKTTKEYKETLVKLAKERGYEPTAKGILECAKGYLNFVSGRDDELQQVVSTLRSILSRL